MASAPSCFVCGSTELVATPNPHSPTCARHIAVRAHVVSMQNDPATGDHVALCQCGWREQHVRDGVPGYRAIDALVKAHWRQICGETE